MSGTKLTGLVMVLIFLSSCASLGLGQAPDRYAGLSPGARRIAKAMDQRDLVLGMHPGHVRAVWGEPLQVEVAGEAEAGHERWIYVDRLLNPAFREFGQQRVVYFERGRVVGWDRQ